MVRRHQSLGTQLRPSARFTAALIPLTVLGIFFALPVSAMIGRGLEDGWSGLIDVWTRPRVGRVLWFTLWSSAIATVACIAIGVPAASVLYRLKWRGQALARTFIFLPFVMPAVVVGIAFRQLFAESGLLGPLNLDQSAVAIVIGLVFFNLPVVIRTVGLAWESLEPEPAQAAAVLGAGPWTVFRRVTLPALRPAIVGAASVVFLFCATAFGVVLMLGGLRYSSVETEIYLLTTNLLDLNAAAALSLLQLGFVVVLLALTARFGKASGAERSVAWARRPAKYDVPAIVTTALAAIFVALPVIALVTGSLQRRGEWTLANYLDLADVAGPALWKSIEIAVAATTIAVSLGLLVAYVLSRPAASPLGRRATAALGGLFMLPLGVSAVTVGFGFLLALSQWRTSWWLVPMAQALVALPLVVRVLTPVWEALEDETRQAAATLAATPWQILRRIEFPVIKGAIAGAAGMAAAVSLGEFGATSFLAREDALTLPVMIFRMVGRPGAENFGGALAASVLLATLCGVVLLLGERAVISRRR